MAVKGAIAKSYIEKKISEIFGQDYVGNYNGKLYINCKENNETVQIAITLTCPKTPIEAKTETTISEVATNNNSAEISQEELNNITELMKKVGII